MKKLVICLFAVSILALPVCAMALDPIVVNCTPPEPGTAVVDIKGYGNQFADYSTGCLDVVSVTTTNTKGTTTEWTGFNNVVGNISPGGLGMDCGMNLSQGSVTTTKFNAANTTTLTGQNLTGAADMTTLGGLAACSTPGAEGYQIPISGTLNQTHTVNNSVVGSICCGIAGRATYSGTQTLNLKIGY